MLAINPSIFAMLFSATIVVTYLAVRLGRLSVYQTFVVGAMANSLFFFLFSIARGNGIIQAIIVGLMLGFVFTTLSVALGNLFRTSAPIPAKERVVVVSSETVKI